MKEGGYKRSNTLLIRNVVVSRFFMDIKIFMNLREVIAVAIFVNVLVLIVPVETKMMYTFSMMRHGSRYPINDLYDGNQTR